MLRNRIRIAEVRSAPLEGRTVFQGNNVPDENSDHALFNELGSSPASMEAHRGACMVVVAPKQMA